MIAQDTNCGIPNTCARIVPAWLILLDNIPTLSLFILGALLFGILWWPLSIIILGYDSLAVIMFWGLICRHCQHFDTKACPSGYGRVAPRYFNRLGGKNFREVFRKNIVIMIPCWIAPLGVGTYLLLARFSQAILILYLSFAAVGFILIPPISRLAGCKGCDLRKKCPWITSIVG
jgi:hypothetical protein